MNSPPRNANARRLTGRREKLTNETLLVTGQNVNRAREIWTPQAIRMLSSFVRTGDARHLIASQRQLTAICARLEGGEP
jgi:hypothetical protein